MSTQVNVSSMILRSAGLNVLQPDAIAKLGKALATAEKTFGLAAADKNGVPIESKKAGCIILTATNCVVVTKFYRYGKGTGGQLDKLFRDNVSQLGFSVETCRYGGGNWTKAMTNLAAVKPTTPAAKDKPKKEKNDKTPPATVTPTVEPQATV